MNQDLVELPENVPAILLSAWYDGAVRRVMLRFYEPESAKFYIWHDQTGHKPYCYTRMMYGDLVEKFVKREGADNVKQEKVIKRDILNDKDVEMIKITVNDPTMIAGGENSIRNHAIVWEAGIKYYERYLFDNKLVMGMFYVRKGLEITPHNYNISESINKALKTNVIDKLKSSEPAEYLEQIDKWANMLNQPIPEIKRLVLDIEVASDDGRMPTAILHDKKIIAAGLVGSDGFKKVFVLKNFDLDDNTELPAEAELCDSEYELIIKTIDIIQQYPVLITFNGDDFDLPYLYMRAKDPSIDPDQGRCLDNDELPFIVKKDFLTRKGMQADPIGLRHGLHIDLYRFFSNKSIQNYAFSAAYEHYGLNDISEGLLGEGKMDLEEVAIGELSMQKLAKYCLHDSDLTCRLTTFNDNITMKLMVIICRISKLPLDDVTRYGVNQWLRGTLYYEHINTNSLIPRRNELEIKGKASTVALIDDKQYRGAMVLEPTPGVHFNVTVMDFASLYPSIIKLHNLSHETINCIHMDCKNDPDQQIEGTAHWACKKRNGLVSILIGALKDIRVNYYKKLAKDKSISEQDRNNFKIIEQACKVYVNASYGVLGFPTFPLFCVPVADSTTALGRAKIMKTINQAKGLSVETLYSDTDSIFAKDPGKKSIDSLIAWAKKQLGIDLEIDKQYRYVVFSSRKKNYIGVHHDGKVDVKGLTGKKSISGDTPIIASINGKTRFTSVKEVYNEYCNGADVMLLTVTDDLRTQFAKISDALKHDVIDDTYMVKTRNGRTLTLSGDHSVYLINNYGHIFCKETKDLKKGDIVIGIKQISSIDSPSDTLNIKEILSDITKDKNETMLISNRAHSTTGFAIEKQLRITPELGFLLAIYASEGKITKDDVRNDSISQNYIINPEVCKEIEMSWQYVFNRQLRKCEWKNTYIYSMPTLHAELFARLCGIKSHEKRIPDFMFNATSEVKSAFLCGLFSGDGYTNKKTLTITSKSKKLMEQTANLLSSFSINVTLRESTRKRYGKYYTIFVIGTSSKDIFDKQIGILQSRFMITRALSPRNKELMPVTTNGIIKLKQDIAKRHELKRFRGINMHDSRYVNRMLLSHYNDVIKALKELADQKQSHILEQISTMINSTDVIYDPIISVEKTEDKLVTMFDFSIPRYERFVAGNIPTLLHNSNTPKFIRDGFSKILVLLGNVQTPQDFEQAKKSITGVISEDVKNLNDNKIPIPDMSFNMTANKNPESYGKQVVTTVVNLEGGESKVESLKSVPQHIKAALLLIKAGKEVKAGDVISFVKCISGPKPVQLAKHSEIDKEKYIESMENTFDQLLPILEMSFKEASGEPKQDTLDSLFWGN